VGCRGRILSSSCQGPSAGKANQGAGGVSAELDESRRNLAHGLEGVSLAAPATRMRLEMGGGRLDRCGELAGWSAATRRVPLAYCTTGSRGFA